MNPLVSIIIPAYNSAKYLSEAVNSALNQTYTNIEVIVVNDGSTDDTLQVAESLKGEKLRVFSQKNKGASAARNRGLKEASGEYIQFLDADDLISAEKIEKQLELLQRHKNHLCICPTVYFFDENDHTLSKPADHWVPDLSDNPVDFLIKLYGGDIIGPEYGGMITVHAWLCPRHVLDKAGPWNEELSVDDDGEYFCRVILASSGILLVRDVFNYYRKFKEGNTLSSPNSIKKQQSAFKSIKLKAQHLLAVTNDKRAKLALSGLFWDITFSLYPNQKAMSLEAENMARAFNPGFKFKPFKGLKAKLASMFGWKTVRWLQVQRLKLKLC